MQMFVRSLQQLQFSHSSVFHASVFFAVQVENERNSPAPYKVGVYFSLFPILWDSSWNSLSSDRPWEAELDRHRDSLGASFWNLKVGVLIGL